MFRNILCLEYKGLLNEIKPLTVSSGYFVKKESYIQHFEYKMTKARYF